jgi:parvulin-like peptidyl-prolyl isomerase
MDNTVILMVAGNNITSSDILIYLKSSGAYKDAIQEVIRRKVITDYASKNSICVTDDELQNYVNDKRKALKLFSTPDVQKYLSTLGLNLDQWADALEYELLENKVKNVAVTDEGIEKYYNENKLQFRKVNLYKIVVENKDKCDEILMELRDDGLNFYNLAIKYSIDETSKFGGGYIGKIGRGVLKIIVEQKIFAAQSGDLVGPFEDNGTFTLYKVADFVEQELNDDFKKQLKETLFKMWTSGYLQSVKIELPK